MNPFSRSEGSSLPRRAVSPPGRSRRAPRPPHREEGDYTASPRRLRERARSRADRAIPSPSGSRPARPVTAGDLLLHLRAQAHQGTCAFSASFATSGYVSAVSSPSPTFRTISVRSGLRTGTRETRSSSAERSTLRRGSPSSNAAIALCSRPLRVRLRLLRHPLDPLCATR